MSFEGELAPSFTLHCLGAGRTLPDGWGLGYYPAGEPSAAILKEPAPPQASIRSQLALAWEQVASSVFVLHIRPATWGALSDANTQPFARTWGRRDWLIAHAGSLDRKAARRPRAVRAGRLDRHRADVLRAAQPVRRARLAEPRRRRSRRRPATGSATLNEVGELTLCLTDGRDLLVHADRRGVAAVARHADAAVRADRVRRRRPRGRSHAPRREEPQGRDRVHRAAGRARGRRRGARA